MYCWWYLPKRKSLILASPSHLLTLCQGVCKDGSVGREIKNWIDTHRALFIGLVAGVGGFLVLLILCCCWRSYRRRSKQRAYAKKFAGAAAVPPPPHRGHGHGHRGHGMQSPNSSGNALMNNQQPMAGPWGPNPNHGPPLPPMQSPPPLYHRSSVRYA